MHNLLEPSDRKISANLHEPGNNQPNSMTTHRKRSILRDLNTAADGVPLTPKTIDARLSLEKAEIYGINDTRSAYSRIMALVGRIFIETIPQWLTIGAMLGLIFGGCCSNVFALEAIVNVEPESGTLLTFVQFIFVAITGYFSQFDRTHPPFFIKPGHVPIRRWMINIVLFFCINVLNNHAFSYNISVPIHIILRSGGSITTLVAGYAWGKRFTRTQIAAVTLLTTGVVIAAWSDQQSKQTVVKTNPGLPPFTMGLGILFIAQLLSAVMGLYTEETYRTYGPYWKENLFYSHLLALPLFIPFIPSMSRQFVKLAASPPLGFDKYSSINKLPIEIQARLTSIHIPSQLAYLVTNVLTQYACVRGVNLLAAVASALTVTIVLNVRKLFSLLLSIWLFGNNLCPGTMVGACIVFFAGGMYGFEGSRKSRNRATTGSSKVG